MNPLLLAAGVEAGKNAAHAAGRGVGSFFNEPIYGTFTLKKLLVILVALGCLYLIYYFFFKKSKKDKINENAAAAVDSIPINSSNLTLTPSDIKLISQQLYDAMEPSGTDEDAIVTAFNRITSKDDLLAVIKQFGTPEYSMFGSPFFSWMPSKYLNLQGWLREELSSEVLNMVRQKFIALDVPF